jgi:hypothetical protein
MKFITCPICNGEAHPVLEEMLVSASFGGQTRDFGGMLVYQCVSNQHVFFVTQRDVEHSMGLYDGHVVLMKEPRARKVWGG